MSAQQELYQFGKPTGPDGEQVGLIMANANAEIYSWTISLLSVTANETVLEIGFGPGTAVEELVQQSQAQFIAGIDHFEVMLAQAAARNTYAIQDGRVELKLGTVALPYEDAFFDKVFAVNSFHFWAERALTDLTEIRRTMKPNGLIAFIPTQPRWASSEQMVDEIGDQLVQRLLKAGFGSIRLEKKEMEPVSVVCVLGTNR